MSRWYYAKGGTQFGPVSSAELKSLADSGKLLPADLVWKEGSSDWRPAEELKGLFDMKSVVVPPPLPTPVFTANRCLIPPIEPSSLARVARSERRPWRLYGASWIAAGFLFVGINAALYNQAPIFETLGGSCLVVGLGLLAFGMLDRYLLSALLPVRPRATLVRVSWCMFGLGVLLTMIPLVQSAMFAARNAAGAANAGTEVRRLKISWQEGTAELQNLDLSSLITNEQKVLLGLGMLVNGADVYAARVRLENIGNVPVVVDPGNITLLSDGERLAAFTIADPRFLPSGSLAPGFYVDGLVAFPAKSRTGASVRFEGGQLFYSDSTVIVE